MASWLERVVKPYAEKAKWKVRAFGVLVLVVAQEAAATAAPASHGTTFTCQLPATAPQQTNHPTSHTRSNPLPHNWPLPPQDTTQPGKWLSEMFDRYVPETIFEMKKNYSHITPLATMNHITSLVNILEGLLRPENLSNKADQVRGWVACVRVCVGGRGGM